MVLCYFVWKISTSPNGKVTANSWGWGGLYTSPNLSYKAGYLVLANVLRTFPLHPTPPLGRTYYYHVCLLRYASKEHVEKCQPVLLVLYRLT